MQGKQGPASAHAAAGANVRAAAAVVAAIWAGCRWLGLARLAVCAQEGAQQPVVRGQQQRSREQQALASRRAMQPAASQQRNGRMKRRVVAP